MVNSHKPDKEQKKPIKPARSQLIALEKLKKLDWNIHVLWNKKGIPSHLCGILSVEIEENPERAARKFLLENLKLFKMKESLKDLTLIKIADSLGGSHVIFQQFFNELPIHNAFISVHMDKKNLVKKVDVCYHPDIYIEPGAKGISQEEAIHIAIDALKAEKRLAGNASGETVIYKKREKYYVAWKIRVIA